MAELPAAARPSQTHTSWPPRPPPLTPPARSGTKALRSPLGAESGHVLSLDTPSPQLLVTFPLPGPSHLARCVPSPDLCSCESLHPLGAPLVLGHRRRPQARGSQTTPAAPPRAYLSAGELQAPIVPPTAATARLCHGAVTLVHSSQARESPGSPPSHHPSTPRRRAGSTSSHPGPCPRSWVPGELVPCPPPSLSRQSSQGVLCKEKSQPRGVPSRSPTSRSRPTVPALCPSRPPAMPHTDGHGVPRPQAPCSTVPTRLARPFLIYLEFTNF